MRLVSARTSHQVLPPNETWFRLTLPQNWGIHGLLDRSARYTKVFRDLLTSGKRVYHYGTTGQRKRDNRLSIQAIEKRGGFAHTFSWRGGRGYKHNRSDGRCGASGPSTKNGVERSDHG